MNLRSLLPKDIRTALLEAFGLGAFAALIAVVAVLVSPNHSAASQPTPAKTTAIVMTVAAQPGPTIIQCETSASTGSTLWIGWPSTIGKLVAHPCRMTFGRGNIVTMTLPGTKDKTRYRLVQFVHANLENWLPYQFPRLRGNLKVTLTFSHGSLSIHAGGPDRLIKAEMLSPHSLGSILLVKVGTKIYELSFYYLG